MNCRAGKEVERVSTVVVLAAKTVSRACIPFPPNRGGGIGAHKTGRRRKHLSGQDLGRLNWR